MKDYEHSELCSSFPLVVRLMKLKTIEIGTNSTIFSVAGLSYAKLLRQLEAKNAEVVKLKNRVKQLESELANYKKMVRKTKKEAL